ncbi:hypothetical protein EII29_02435 [Leptotrichia sp. OH3620_COT-345]|uniref:hypothetical protein n=1 Tax=Leptotrichia sp. OH3620_COT-345 TaxID=2491048 RepID=UPI000F645C71|nr:hypothetical protein [Leptotrichia sp. OH3620_COT-345]RRD40356.1 hypothetical protein EII29_02435 [Leptotrichia sp. OH3620_COT-345]
MKKLLILMMLLFSVSVFAEKLTTDGKDNLDKLKGNWDSILASIEKKNNNWYIEYSSGEVGKISKYKSGILVFNLSDEYNKYGNTYFAWDIKYKTLVMVDRNGNILSKEKRVVECIRNQTCN